MIADRAGNLGKHDDGSTEELEAYSYLLGIIQHDAPIIRPQVPQEDAGHGEGSDQPEREDLSIALQ